MNIKWHINKVLVKLAVKFLKLSGLYDGYWNNWRGELFTYCEKQGLHILPVHYYSPIPNTSQLPKSIWDNKSELIGISLNLDQALNLVAKLSENYISEYDKFPSDPTNNPKEYYLNNSAYNRGEAEILYSMIRDLKPKKIIEIGSGRTTLLMSQAIRQNKTEDPNYSCNFICIEPYLPNYLKPVPSEVTRVIESFLQKVPLEEFTSLDSGDILFIDSSHVVNIGSDVVYEYLEILPRLKQGVIIHIHDIFMPMEYPQKWIEKNRFFWNEQYLLQAFLQFNPNFEVLIPTYALAKLYSKDIEKYIPSCARGEYSPGSFWIKKCG